MAKEERAQLCDRALDYFSEVDRPVPSNELVRVLFPRASVANGHSPRLVREVLRRDRRFQEPRDGTWDLVGARYHHMPIDEARFCVVDVEATGSNPRRDQVIEVGIVVIEGLKVTRRFGSLVNPEQPIPTWIRKLTGIKDAHVEQAPCFGEIAPEVERLLRNGVFVAHNVDFDARFLRGRLEAAGVNTPWWPTLCTVRLSRRLLSEQGSFRLDALADGLGIPMGRHHRATSDADAAAGILLHIVEDRATELGIETVGDLIAASRGPVHKRAS
jgi:DNA polymerase III epsilon subunit family exonuclease